MDLDIRHQTTFNYSETISLCLMELRLKPMISLTQECLSFTIQTRPSSSFFHYMDHFGNTVYHFNLLNPTTVIEVYSQAYVRTNPIKVSPKLFNMDSWKFIDDLHDDRSFWHWLQESYYCKSTPALQALKKQLHFDRRQNPFQLLIKLNQDIFENFSYVPKSTHVHSPIDHALENRKGVCQDFSHIMITLVRQLGIPARYVSGYLFHRTQDHDRSISDATHAWMEAFIPPYGWIGFDPANNLIAEERHVQVAIGRDYHDVPPNKGIFTGNAKETLAVHVDVSPTQVENLQKIQPLPISARKETTWMENNQ